MAAAPPGRSNAPAHLRVQRANAQRIIPRVPVGSRPSGVANRHRNANISRKPVPNSAEAGPSGTARAGRSPQRRPRVTFAAPPVPGAPPVPEAPLNVSGIQGDRNSGVGYLSEGLAALDVAAAGLERSREAGRVEQERRANSDPVSYDRTPFCYLYVLMFTNIIH